MQRSAGEGDKALIDRLEKRIIELLAFGVFAVDGDQEEVDRQIANCRKQIIMIEEKIRGENDAKEC